MDNQNKKNVMEFRKDAYVNALGELTKEQRKEAHRLEFKAETKRIIAGRAGYHCSFPGCKNETIGPGDNENEIVVLGEAAHIIGAIYGGENSISPRSNINSTKEEIISANNGIWLCKNHHKLVDSKTATYTAEKLIEYKQQMEKTQSKNLEKAKSEFIDTYVKPNINTKKGIDMSRFSEKALCLLAFVIDNYDNKSVLDFYNDEDNRNFENQYRNWMNKNSINEKTAKISFDLPYTEKISEIRNIVNELTGLVAVEDYGLNHGSELDDFYEKMVTEDENALESLIKELSIL